MLGRSAVHDEDAEGPFVSGSEEAFWRRKNVNIYRAASVPKRRQSSSPSEDDPITDILALLARTYPLTKTCSRQEEWVRTNSFPI